jgi:hypothetical protein
MNRPGDIDPLAARGNHQLSRHLCLDPLSQTYEQGVVGVKNFSPLLGARIARVRRLYPNFQLS